MTEGNPLRAPLEMMSERVARPSSEAFSRHHRVSGASITRPKQTNMRHSNPLAASVARRGESPVQTSRKRTASEATLDYTDCSCTKRPRCEEHEAKPLTVPAFCRREVLLIPDEGPMIVLTPSEDVSQACDRYLPAQNRSFLVVKDKKATYPYKSLEEKRRRRRFKHNRSYHPPMLTDEVPGKELPPRRRRQRQSRSSHMGTALDGFSKLALNPLSAPSTGRDA